MTRPDLLALAERCEKEGATLVLEQEVFALVYGWSTPLVGAAWTEWNECGRPRYCTSVDVAAALVPKVWRIEHIGEQLSGGRWDVELHRREYSMEDCVKSVAATPALALCAASLRALAARKTEEEG